MTCGCSGMATTAAERRRIAFFARWDREAVQGGAPHPQVTTHVFLGQWYDPAAVHKNVTGMPTAPVTVLSNVENVHGQRKRWEWLLHKVGLMTESNRPKVHLGAGDFGQRTMTATPIGRIVMPSVALVAALSAALALGIAHTWREPPVGTATETAAPTGSPPTSGARNEGNEGSTALVPAQGESNALAAALDLSSRAPDPDESVPVFDITRIERTGEAVVAGRAAPGATVDLLLKGKPYDRAVADESGQFVMVPSRLPIGTYELTLRSRQPDGKLTISKESVSVGLWPDGEDQSVVALITPDQDVSSPQVNQSSPPPLQTGQDIAISRQQQAATAVSNGDSPSKPIITTTVISRGDSLWRISRANYGKGVQYRIIYRANRNQIRNPNLIYPGQILVLPTNDR
jgi:hypothetical protein